MRAQIHDQALGKDSSTMLPAFYSEDWYYFATTTPGGFQVPAPGGRIDGGVSFGQ